MSTRLSLKARLSQDLVCVVLSAVVGRVVELVSGHLRPSSVEALVYRGCPCRDPPVCHRVQGDSVAKRQPFCVLVGVLTSRVLCARVRGHVSRSCATEKTYTPARMGALFKLSVVTILRHSYRSLQDFCGLWVLSPTRHLVRHVLHLVRDLVEIFLLVVCSVAIRLVHAKTNLFLSR